MIELLYMACRSHKQLWGNTQFVSGFDLRFKGENIWVSSRKTLQ